MKEGKKREDDAEIATRDRVLHAASRVFARCPFEMATLKMIAEESGIKHSLIMYHFKTKNKLYQDVLDRAAKCYAAVLEPIFSQVENSERLTPDLVRKLYIEIIDVTIDGMFSCDERQCPYVNIIMMEARYPTESYHDLYDRYFKRHYDLIIRMIRTINPSDDDKTSMWKLVQVFGLLDSFQGEEKALKKHIDFDLTTDEAKKKIKELAMKNAFLIIEAPP